MKTHFQYLKEYISGLTSMKILDLGAGAGEFLIECAKHHCEAVGLELNHSKIAKALDLANKEQVQIDIKQGVAESLPFDSDEFDFINVSEVIEHVVDPKTVLAEMYRVMKPGGCAYVSVHNRFGMYDTHFHLYFLGWLPRSLASRYISLFSKDKNYDKMPDKQRLSDMHYYTFRGFQKLVTSPGFLILDVRDAKVKAKYGYLGSIFYRLIRPWYFSTFHFLLRK